MAEKKTGNVALNVALSPIQAALPACKYLISQLETELRDLREELTRAERASANSEMLLRNALVREMELRATMFKEK